MSFRERGQAGDRGVTGDRGERGDHGQRGEQGRTGAAGADAPYLSRNRTLALFIFVVLAFMLLGIRTSANTADIREGSYQNCLLRSEIENAADEDCERLR